MVITDRDPVTHLVFDVTRESEREARFDRIITCQLLDEPTAANATNATSTNTSTNTTISPSDAAKTTDSASKEIFIVDHVQWALNVLSLVHTMQWISLLLAKLLKTYSINMHGHYLLKIITIPAYQMAIFYALFEVTHNEEIAYQKKCVILKNSYRQAWIYIEIAAFFSNFTWPIIETLSRISLAGGGNYCLYEHSNRLKYIKEYI